VAIFGCISGVVPGDDAILDGEDSAFAERNDRLLAGDVAVAGDDSLLVVGEVSMVDDNDKWAGLNRRQMSQKVRKIRNAKEEVLRWSSAE
jgi:hypothetical protein